MNQNGYGSSYLTGASNPNMVRRHIAQDVGQGQGVHGGQGYSTSSAYSNPFAPPSGYQPIQNQGEYNAGVFQQVMSAGPYNAQEVRNQIQQDIAYGSLPPSHVGGHQLSQQPQFGQQSFGGSTLSQFGSDAQMVRQHIHSDLQSGQGYLTAAQAGQYSGGMMSQSGQHSGGMMSQGGQYSGGMMSQGGQYSGGMMSQGGQYSGGMMSQSGQYSGGMMSQGGQYGGGLLSQFGSNAQVVQSHIHEDLHGVRGSVGQSGYGYGTSMMSAGASNPQSVRQNTASDLGPTYM